jgi:alanyl-tRNA synthetase
LQEVLGDHVRQRGSAVRPDKLRFDFSHGEPMTAEQLHEVEDIVNRVVVENHPVRSFETSQDEARRLGAMMLFGEKYGDVVRVVEIEDFSRELCGGTHVSRTAEIGPFKILSESSVGQGVRRIEAITSGAALELLRDRERAALTAARELRTDPERLPEAIARLREQVREAERRAREAGSGAADRLEELAASAEAHGAVKVLVADLGETDAEELLELSDRLRGRLGTAVVVLASRTDGKVHLVAAATPDAVDAGVDAGALIRAAAPHVGGGGGGRPGMARAGGKDAAGIPAALDAARIVLAERLDG